MGTFPSAHSRERSNEGAVLESKELGNSARTWVAASKADAVTLATQTSLLVASVTAVGLHGATTTGTPARRTAAARMAANAPSIAGVRTSGRGTRGTWRFVTRATSATTSGASTSTRIHQGAPPAVSGGDESRKHTVLLESVVAEP